MRTRRRGVRALRWGKADYYRLGELGFFQGRRVELIGGRLVVHSPQNVPHASAVENLTYSLIHLFGPSFRVRVQLPLDLGVSSEPEPDFAVLGIQARQTMSGHPTRADLVVEVSDTTLAYDRGRKGSLYARAGIADYWVVNLVEKQVEVYRDPVQDPAQPFGWRYATRTDLKPPAAVAPLALPGASAAVADLLT